jgi:hypothetical protein
MAARFRTQKLKKVLPELQFGSLTETKAQKIARCKQ